VKMTLGNATRYEWNQLENRRIFPTSRTTLQIHESEIILEVQCEGVEEERM